MSSANHKPMITIVSGLSGSGKTVALRTFEDIGYYCIDNLPGEMLPELIRKVSKSQQDIQNIAVSIDVRNRYDDLSDVGQWLSSIGRHGFDHRLVFFDSRDEILIKRYSDTRRRHPLSHLGLALPDALTMERQALRPIQALADHTIDTSDLNVHQLRKLLLTDLVVESGSGVTLLFESFAYKRGIPVDADFVFDARALPNPHWIPELRPLSGRDQRVREFFASEKLVCDYLAELTGFLENWIPRFESETRSYITLAFGCTGGRHRSVYLAESLATHFRNQGREDVLSFHRELE